MSETTQLAPNPRGRDVRAFTAVKMVVAGGFGAGKTTLVASLSEIPPLTTEEELTLPSSAFDDLAAIPQKNTTTVACDFGRITLHDIGAVVYLFGTPGQHRFWFLWDDLCEGAIGAIVLVDTRRLADCFDAIDHFVGSGLPFVVAVNRFADDPHHYTTDEVRDALGIGPAVPLLLCDARIRVSALSVLRAWADHVVTSTNAAQGATV